MSPLTNFTPQDHSFMLLALEQARLAGRMGEIPVGAAVVRNGRVLALAHNLREGAHDPTGHAELLAIRAAAQALGNWRLEGCTLYVTLEPCPMCAGAIQQARLSRVIFGARDARAGCCGSVYRIPEDPALPGFCVCDGGLMEAECAQMLSEFFRNSSSESRPSVGAANKKAFDPTGGRAK